MKLTKHKLEQLILQEMATSKSQGSNIGRYEPPEDFDPELIDLAYEPKKYHVELVEELPSKYRIDVYKVQPDGAMLFSGSFPKRGLFNSKEEAQEFHNGPVFSRIFRKLLDK